MVNDVVNISRSCNEAMFRTLDTDRAGGQNLEPSLPPPFSLVETGPFTNYPFRWMVMRPGVLLTISHSIHRLTETSHPSALTHAYPSSYLWCLLSYAVAL